MKIYCTQNNGDCESCSLSSYGKDCQNKNIKQGRPEKGFETAQLNNRVRKDLKEKFLNICTIKGYSAQLQLEKMIEEWIQKEEPRGKGEVDD